jgi:hypothetical protein
MSLTRPVHDDGPILFDLRSANRPIGHLPEDREGSQAVHGPAAGQCAGSRRCPRSIRARHFVNRSRTNRSELARVDLCDVAH